MAKKRVSGKWGNWRFKGDTFVLTVTVKSGTYEFDFDKCRTSAGILDQLLQLYTIAWLKDKDIKDLLKGIDAVLAPQANYCSSGQHKSADPREVARRNGYKDVAAKKPKYRPSLAGPKGGKAWR